MLLLLAIVPIWNAIALYEDFNYVFWAGISIPRWIVVVSFLMIFVYAIVTILFFRRPSASTQTEENIMNLATVVISLFGLFLMIVAGPLKWQADTTASSLLLHCKTSEEVHRLYEFQQVLQNIRATPACAKKFSVVECAGYQASYPYTQYLKDAETNYLCSGFCSKKTVHQPSSHSSITKAAGKPVLLSSKETEVELRMGEASSWTYPPTLFSDANYQASCEGMAARSMRNFAGDIGHQTFFQGLFLVVIAVATGFLKLLGFCVRKR